MAWYPSDAELVEHLEAKCGMGNSEQHKFIDEFILTLEVNEGICYTHPENLPGAKKDGTSIHFFYRITNAYATGKQKRRIIHDESNLMKEHVRWHKTGKTKVVMENGLQKGCKKVMVLYQTIKKGSKQEKTNWVMHQYHLGPDKYEKECEYVVSKIFYQQQKQSVKANDSCYDEKASVGANQTGPTTPKTVTPNPPRDGETPSYDDIVDDSLPFSPDQEVEVAKEPGQPCDAKIKCEMEYSTCLAGESQAADANDVDNSLLCDEHNGYSFLDGFGPNLSPSAYYTLTLAIYHKEMVTQPAEFRSWITWNWILQISNLQICRLVLKRISLVGWTGYRYDKYFVVNGNEIMRYAFWDGEYISTRLCS